VKKPRHIGVLFHFFSYKKAKKETQTYTFFFLSTKRKKKISFPSFFL